MYAANLIQEIFSTFSKRPRHPVGHPKDDFGMQGVWVPLLCQRKSGPSGEGAIEGRIAAWGTGGGINRLHVKQARRDSTYFHWGGDCHACQAIVVGRPQRRRQRGFRLHRRSRIPTTPTTPTTLDRCCMYVCVCV